MKTLLHRVDGLIEKLPVSPRFFRFCVVGGSGVLVNLIVLWLLTLLLPQVWGVWHHRGSMAGAIAVSIFTNFLLNDAWTWKDRQQRGASWAKRLGMFYLVSAGAALVQWGVGVLLYEQLLAGLAPLLGFDVWLYVAQATGIVLAMSINFTLNHFWTFRRRQPPAA